MKTFEHLNNSEFILLDELDLAEKMQMRSIRLECDWFGRWCLEGEVALVGLKMNSRMSRTQLGLLVPFDEVRDNEYVEYINRKFSPIFVLSEKPNQKFGDICCIHDNRVAGYFFLVLAVTVWVLVWILNRSMQRCWLYLNRPSCHTLTVYFLMTYNKSAKS